jgi:hypothetical protein
MDLWNWTAGRSNPLGYVNDEWANASARKNDAGTPLEIRNWKTKDNIPQGPGFYRNPASGLQTVTLPNPAEGTTALDKALFLLRSKAVLLAGNATAGETVFSKTCEGCHSLASMKSKFAVRGLTQTDAQIKAFISSADHPGSFVAGDLTAADWGNVSALLRACQGVPGYLLQPPSGSSADLVVMNSKTVYNKATGLYSVVFRRKLITGNPDDVQFDLATKKDYVFGVAIMNKDGKNHAGKAVQHLKFL